MKKKREEAGARIAQLREIINEQNRRYYIENQPVISDFEYDLLLNELQTLEKTYPGYFSENSPTVRVGSDLSDDSVASEFKQATHKYPMLSLSNTYDKDELYAFLKQVPANVLVVLDEAYDEYLPADLKSEAIKWLPEFHPTCYLDKRNDW